MRFEYTNWENTLSNCHLYIFLMILFILYPILKRFVPLLESILAEWINSLANTHTQRVRTDGETNKKTNRTKKKKSTNTRKKCTRSLFDESFYFFLGAKWKERLNTFRLKHAEFHTFEHTFAPLARLRRIHRITYYIDIYFMFIFN